MAENEGKQETFVEEMKLAGSQVVAKVRELIQEGNVRRIIVKQKGKSIMEIPLTLGVVGAVLAPVLAALGAAAALITECTLEVERVKNDKVGSRK